MMTASPPRDPETADRASVDKINQRIFETSLDLILVVERDGTLLRVSPSANVILGYTPDEMTGRSAVHFIYPDDLENTRNEMRLARRGKEMRNFDCRYVHKDGRVVPLAWTGVWSDPEAQHFFIGRDMTERLAQEDRLRRSQKLEAVGQLTGGIAHDFNNLLAVVIGNLDMLEDRIKADPMAAEFAQSALQAALRGAELTRQLLAFARRQPLNAQSVDLNAQVHSVIDLLRRTLGERIVVKLALADDLWAALADPAQFESALVNLAINARDAMRDGGRLTIETENKQLDENYATGNVEVTAGDYVMLAVSDTGTGMPPEILARVFEPFFTTKPPGEGSGMGLSMVYGFARQSRGHIKIYSEFGRGTTVRLYLPRAERSAASGAETTATALPKAEGGERILVVEDSPQVRKVVVSQIIDLGYQVIEAEDGDAALDILKTDTVIDLLFTDMVMPGALSGHDLALAAQKFRPGLKVLLTSGFAKAAIDSSIPAASFENFLSKPYRKADLAAKLRDILQAPSS